jgi:prepilin-type N-terminal cleavage/methylation domain-containing protein
VHGLRGTFRSRNKSGFTLVELLIVIGIIAILIGVVMPVFAKARVASRRVACRAQLADIGRFFQMYLNDSKGKLPCIQTMPSVQPALPPVDGKPATEVLAPYVKLSTRVWHCPADQITQETPNAPLGFDEYFKREGLSYLYNAPLSIQYAGQRINETRLYRAGQQNRLVIFNEFEPFHGKATTNGSMNYLFADMHVGDLANE